MSFVVWCASGSDMRSDASNEGLPKGVGSIQVCRAAVCESCVRVLTPSLAKTWARWD